MDSHQFPPLGLVAQSPPAPGLPDPALAVARELGRLSLGPRVKPGQSVAITAGSRAIAQIPSILAVIVAEMKKLRAEPCIFPAMGSHGGATAQGQTELLASLGITEESVGAPIEASMDTIQLGETNEGIPVHVSQCAAQADHIVVVNRVKPHTKFKGEIESGLMKMLAVGMGLHQGAAALHALAPSLGMETVIRSPARLALKQLPVLFGLGIVETANHQVHSVKALLSKQLEAGEQKLLVLAKELAPKLPFPDIDLLIVDEIGKNFSGTGMDPNVTGRNRDLLGEFTTGQTTRRILVRDLSPASKGNGLGIGLADFSTDRAVAAMDYQKTLTNALTAMSPEKAAIPPHFSSDQEAVLAALNSLGRWSPDTTKLVRIPNTLHIQQAMVSPALLRELPGNLRVVAEPSPMVFTEKGNLLDFPGKED
ncbi:MAG: DUF2088 domain-containing protein [Desulfovibrio sp.]|nr:MAG: DUF2088 domain-containing protein [Desulfovibrio sp.]